MGQTLQVKTSDLVNEYKLLTKDSSDNNVLVGKLRMQHHYTFLASEANNYAVEKTRYAVTKAAQRSYLMGPDYFKIKTVRVKSGDQWHPLEEVVSLEKWHARTGIVSSNAIPTHFIIINDDGNVHIELDAVPSADGDPEDPNLEFIYEGYLDPLNFPADYVTGTISVTNGSAVITGSGTTITAAMVGRFLNVGKWFYEIASVINGTTFSLVNYYQEATGSGQSYTIAELLRLPPEFSYTPLWGALADYWRNGDKELSKQYEGYYVRELLMLQNKYKSKSKGAVTVGRPVGGIPAWTPRNYPNGLLTTY